VTATGTFESVFVPFPNCPTLLRPQQVTPSNAFTKHVCSTPEETLGTLIDKADPLDEPLLLQLATKSADPRVKPSIQNELTDLKFFFIF
jgi:hypothetical protein